MCDSRSLSSRHGTHAGYESPRHAARVLDVRRFVSAGLCAADEVRSGRVVVRVLLRLRAPGRERGHARRRLPAATSRGRVLVSGWFGSARLPAPKSRVPGRLPGCPLAVSSGRVVLHVGCGPAFRWISAGSDTPRFNARRRHVSHEPATRARRFVPRRGKASSIRRTVPDTAPGCFPRYQCDVPRLLRADLQRLLRPQYHRVHFRVGEVDHLVIAANRSAVTASERPTACSGEVPTGTLRVRTTSAAVFTCPRASETPRGPHACSLDRWQHGGISESPRTHNASSQARRASRTPHRLVH